jgi:diguanylate cyclase (GGDEF)-like protein
VEYTLALVVLAAAAEIAVLAFAIVATVSLRRVQMQARPEPEMKVSKETSVDPGTGLASSGAWDQVLLHEASRFARYGRPVTIVVAELDGIDSLAAILGQTVADTLVPPVASAMRRHAREADILARTGRGRFVALLPETDEISATNYVERVRAECDAWLESGALAVHLAVGWAQPPAGSHLADALHLAEVRMNADRRRPDLGTPSVAEMPGDDRRSHPLVALH